MVGLTMPHLPARSHAFGDGLVDACGEPFSLERLLRRFNKATASLDSPRTSAVLSSSVPHARQRRAKGSDKNGTSMDTHHSRQ
jgi:hypothetical protein